MRAQTPLETRHRNPRPATNSTDKPLRVAILGYRSNPFSGGQGVYIKYLSKALVEAGHSVDVISAEPYPHVDPRVRLIKLPGLNLYSHFPYHARALRPRHFLSATDLVEYFSMLTGGFPEPYAFGRRLKQLFNKTKPDYDVIHDNQTLAWGVLDLVEMGYPLVTTIHHPITWDRDIALSHARDWRERIMIRRWHSFLNMQMKVAGKLPHVVTVSHRSRQDIADVFEIERDSIDVVHNGIDTDDFFPVDGITRDQNLIISTASADQPLKGLQHLLPAFARLREGNAALKLIIVGKPKTDGDTMQLIERLNLGASVEFRHGLSTEALRRLYAEAAVAVVPSEYEGFGLPAGEAMACGVPVVSSDGGALPEVVGDAGIVVPAKSPQALAKAIEALLGDESQRLDLSARGQNRVSGIFTWGRAADAMTSIYRRAIKETPTAPRKAG